MPTIRSRSVGPLLTMRILHCSKGSASGCPHAVRSSQLKLGLDRCRRRKMTEVFVRSEAVQDVWRCFTCTSNVSLRHPPMMSVSIGIDLILGVLSSSVGASGISFWKLSLSLSRLKLLPKGARNLSCPKSPILVSLSSSKLNHPKTVKNRPLTTVLLENQIATLVLKYEFEAHP